MKTFNKMRNEKGEMRNYFFSSSIFVLSALCFLLSSCSNDEDSTPFPTQNDSAVVVAKFQELFYYKDGNTKLVQMEDDATSWVAGVESGEDVCRIFNTITGAEEKPTDTYNYKYQSQDRSVSISVKGNLTPNDEAVFAIMEVVIPNYPEVREIHLVDPDYFNGVSPGTVITVISL